MRVLRVDTTYVYGKMCENNPVWLTVLLYSNQYDENQIVKAFEFARCHFMEIQLKDDFLQLKREFFVRLIESDDLNVYSESVVFESVTRWLAYNHLNPTTELHFLIEFVRLPLLSAEYLLSVVEPSTFPSTESRPYFLEALRYHLFPDQRSALTSPRTKPRKSFQKFLAVGSFHVSTADVVEIYDASSYSWNRLKKISNSKIRFGAAFVDDSLMIIGGIDKATSNTVTSYNLTNGRVTTIAPLQESRYNFGIAVIGKGRSAVVYAIGGMGENGALKTVERWDLVNRTWSYVMPMIINREAFGVATVGDEVYVAGGRDKNQFFNSVVVYNVKADRWQIKSSMNRTRTYFNLAAAGEYIYAIGGYKEDYGKDPQLEMERYDPRIDTWMLISKIPFGGWVGVGTLRNRPFYVGGVSDNTSVAEFDPVKKVWNNLASLGVGRQNVTVIELPWDYDICIMDTLYVKITNLFQSNIVTK
ncbi:uncharacterized protein LOC143920897 [Arctopsyche grandis]|uniref:uncharacterized protein LOC143920897 n=1 Tax=Arctopsyche grandis TaxID=121162 RepID=UPI00406D916A